MPHPTPTNLLTLALAAAITLAAPLSAGIIETTADAPVSSGVIGTFQTVLTSGASVVAVSDSAAARSGPRYYVSSIPAYTGSPRRAEIDDGQFGHYGNDILWYGVSYRVPATAAWQVPGLRQYVGQLRFSNLTEGAAPIPNISMNTGRGGVHHGGSGHHLVVDDGHWSFALRYQDPGVASGLGLFSKNFQLPPVTFGVWTDFVMQARWTAGTHGFVKIWMQEDGGGYQQILDYHGPTWIDTYAAESAKAGQPVRSPNFTAGLYYGNDPQARSLDVDEVKTSDFPGPDGFDHVRAGGAYAPADFPTASTDWTTTPIGVSGGSASYDSANTRFVLNSAGAGFGSPTGGDQLRLLHLPLPEDGVLVARINYQSPNAGPDAEVGLMLRASTAPDAPFVAVGTRVNGEARAVARIPGEPALAASPWSGGANLGKHIRLVRRGDHVTAHFSRNGSGTGWRPLGEYTLPLGSAPLAGFYVFSGNTTSAEGRLRNTTLYRATLPWIPQRAPDPGVTALSARYRFEQNLADSAPGGAPLTALVGTPAFTSSGAPDGGSALALDGSSAVGFAGSPAVRPDSDFTVSAWVKPAALGALGTLVSGGDDNGFRLRHEADGTLALILGDTTSSAPLAAALSTQKLVAGVWQHVAVAVDCEHHAAYVTFFIDGVLAGTWGVPQGVIETASAPFVIGARTATGGEFFTGAIDDVRIQLGALTRDEAPLLAAGEILGAPPPLADFETDSGYSLGEIAGQPAVADTATWTSPNALGLAHVIAPPGESRLLELRADARLHDTIRLTPLASDLGLVSDTPASARLAFSVRLRFPDHLAGNTTLTHVVSLFRDRSGTHKGRAVRLSLRRDGRVTLANNNQILGTLPDAATWATLSGVADFATRTVTLGIDDNPPATNVPFINEGGAGMDEYGYVEFGASSSGVRIWIDDLDLVAAP